MIYYTLLVYLKKNRNRTFNKYESKVLLLLKKYNGKLELRLRTDRSRTLRKQPDEIHIFSFITIKDFNKYLDDPERKKLKNLLNASVIKTELIKGSRLDAIK